MATLASSKIRISTLLAVARGDFYMNNMGGKTTISAIEWLQANGYVDFKTTPRDGYLYFVTAKGIEVLDIHAPMVDQPQLSSEVEPQPFKVGDLVYYINAWNHICTATVMNVTGDVIMILTSAGGTLERKVSDLRLVTGSYNDDLPFTDVGNDPDDTQELPTVKVEAEMSLSQLVDAALLGATPCKRIDALRTLRNGFDWASVPSDALEAEVVDVNQAYEDAVANRRLLSSKMMNDFWGYAELKDYVKAESFTWAVNAVYVLLNKQLSHRRLHAMGAYNA